MKPKLATSVVRRMGFGWDWIVYEYARKPTGQVSSFIILSRGTSFTRRRAGKRASSEYQKHFREGKYEENTKQVN